MTHNSRILCLAFVCASILVTSVFIAAADVKTRPLIFAHRGASGYRPEHTAAAYNLAIEQGADAIEPDLVFSKDGVLVVRHENNIRDTTDVSDKFPERKTIKKIDGRDEEGWFVEDFSWDELATLRAKERLTDRDHSFDGHYPILKFVDVITIAKSAARPVMVLPELKHPTYFRSLGFDPERTLAEELTNAEWNTSSSPVIVQSFEPSSLERLRSLSSVHTALLIDSSGKPFDYEMSGNPLNYSDLLKPSELDRIRHFAEWIAPHKALIDQCWFFGLLAKSPSNLVANAHQAGLKVVTWTLRKEFRFVPTCHYGRFNAEIRALQSAGVDAIFTDQPDVALNAFTL